MINRSQVTERIKRGVVINRLDYKSKLDQLLPSETYNFIANNQESLKSELQRAGLRLIHNPTEGYYYASGDDLENITTFFSLVAIAQAAYNKLESIEAICDPQIGVSISDLVNQRNANKDENLVATRRETREIMSELIDKGLVYTNKSNKLVITNSARSMVETHLNQ